MERLIIHGLRENTENGHAVRLESAIGWLASLGGGTVLFETKTDCEGSIEDLGDYQNVEQRSVLASLEGSGIELRWATRGIPSRGNVVAAFTSPATIQKLESKDLDAFLAIEWVPGELDGWAKSHDVCEAN